MRDRENFFWSNGGWMKEDDIYLLCHRRNKTNRRHSGSTITILKDRLL